MQTTQFFLLFAFRAGANRPSKPQPTLAADEDAWLARMHAGERPLLPAARPRTNRALSPGLREPHPAWAADEDFRIVRMRTRKGAIVVGADRAGAAERKGFRAVGEEKLFEAGRADADKPVVWRPTRERLFHVAFGAFAFGGKSPLP